MRMAAHAYDFFEYFAAQRFKMSSSAVEVRRRSGNASVRLK
jgi:hypothetical protein